MPFGIDVGGTTVKYGEISASGEILRKGSLPTPATEGHDSVVSAIVQAANELRTTSNELPSALGIAFPSVVHNGTTYQLSQHPRISHGFDLHGALEHALPDTRFVIENDANAAALAEAHLGAGEDHPDFLYVTLGTGVGGGVILNKQIYRGPHGDAGEIGHVIVNGSVTESTRPNYRQGVLEEIVGSPAIIRRYVDANGGAPEEPFGVSEIDKRATSGEPLARQVMDDTGYWLGVGLCSALTTIGLRVVIVGGGVSMSDIILEGALATIRERAIPSIAETRRAEACPLPERHRNRRGSATRHRALGTIIVSLSIR